MRTLSLLLLFAVGSVVAQVRSDLETVRAFERKAKQISIAIDSAKTVQECAEIRLAVEQLKTEFADDKDLLDKSLYGENFDQRLESLSGKLILSERKLGVIESQIARIVDLETQVRELSARVESLTTENAQLLSDVDRLSNNVKGLAASGAETSNMVDSLKKVIGRLQKGLKERDDMIFALVDSLFMQYDKDLTQSSDAEMKGMVIKLDRNNVVAGVTTSILNNIQFLERAELTGNDLASILKEQARFSSQWKGIGPKLTSLYMGKRQRARELAAIDTLLVRWSEKASEAQWRGMYQAFTNGGLALEPFSSGTAFVSSVKTFIEGEQGSEKTGDEKDSTWTRFEKVWQEQFHASWVPLLVERGDISADDKAMLDEKVDAWRSAMAPTSPFVYALIFIVIVALLAVGYVMFIRNRPPQMPKA